ncbi:MAG: SDR family NAD(P)-dependent oxidoreductase [Bacteroidetes bacterium]|nr:SDR family NAD(P)-dependent oxidoreductase [Bacteroidota bacterium]
MQRRSIFITGATSGFGKAIAEKFAAGGCDLVLAGRRNERLEQISKDLSHRFGCSVTNLCFDIRDKDAVHAAIVRLNGLPIDVLVNNAGLAAGMAPIQEGKLDDWEQMIDTNLKGLLYITRALSPGMVARRKGHIINIGSTAGKQAYRNGNVYSATKFAVDSLNQGMRIDLLPHGIKVTAINPGMAETEFSLVRFHGDAVRAKAVYHGIDALKAEDIADAAWYCANLPEHVCINDLTLTCTAQANSFYSERKQD